jgi:hypothetical protein
MKMKLFQLANATVFVIVESAVMKSFVEGLGAFRIAPGGGMRFTQQLELACEISC